MWFLALPWLLCALYEWATEKKNKFLDLWMATTVGLLESESNWISACSPGEMADKVSILALKLRKLGDKIPEDRELWLRKQLDASLFCFERQIKILLPETPSKQHKLDLLLDELARINEEQWDWEDRVRSEQSPTKGWEAALGARECNNRRIRCKNSINQICDCGEEEKRYASKD